MTIVQMLSYHFMQRALIVGVLVSLCAALLGVSLVLKRYSMICDGLSHVGFGALAIASALHLAPLAVAVPVVIVTAVLLLLDEPVTGLDPIATGEMYNLIKLVNLCDDITVVMVSHDIHAAVRYATHILHLGHKQLYFGTAADYRESAQARRFLGGNRL
jgi:energy-coupling factor transporter ATP-binding protein EcfA2